MIFALQLLLSLSILILLHEAGHFIPAKIFKTRVEKFYLFFDLGFSLFKKKIGDTTYGIGWLPLGGYVKIAGMVDESMDTKQLAQPAQPWEFRSKPAWQRLIIMIGGVTVNVILGILFYAIVFWVWGKEYLPADNVVYGVHCDSLMYNYGFRDGDKIISLNGEKPEGDFQSVNKSLLLDNISTVQLEREGRTLTLALPANFGQILVDSGVRMAFAVRIPCVVDSVVSGTPASDAGLLKGDSIVGVNNFYSPFFQDIQRRIHQNAGDTIALHIIRNNLPYRITAAVSDEGTIGFSIKTNLKSFKLETKDYSLLAALPEGAKQAWSTVTDYSSQLKFLFTKSGAKQVGGFVTFAKLFPPSWNWATFWERTAFISLVLAFMNILPIPALDGGHVIFLLWEMITGRAVSQKILERAQLIGIVLLLSLMIFGNGMDIIRLLR
jgi:regulator of sigma E protease